MKHVKSTTRQTPVKAQVYDPYQAKKAYLFGPFSPGGFTK